MSMSLEKMVAVAAQVYPDNFLEKAFSRQSEADSRGGKTGEALAAYIAEVFIDLYDPNSSDEANIARIAASLERSVHLLEKIVAELRRLRARSAV